MEQLEPDAGSLRAAGERKAVAGLVLAAAGLLAACQPSPSILDPRSPDAERIAFLWWVMFVLGALVWLAVMVVLGLGLWRRVARGAGDQPPAEPDESEAAGGASSTAWIVGGGIIMPAIVLLVTYAFSVGTARALRGNNPNEIVIDVVGHQFWWEVGYPGYDFVTANEIHIPAGQPVTFRLTTADVIHSFWVPQLHGKIDLIPDKITTLTLQADAPGIYRGQCAEFCGVQHAKMGLLIIADSPVDFAAWVERQQQPAPPPQDDVTRAGQQAFLNAACVYCHTIEGTPATGKIGPDLTHLASRNTLAAATILNTRGHLGGWIVDPQSIKPGNRMPPTDLSPEELQAMLTYLESLR